MHNIFKILNYFFILKTSYLISKENIDAKSQQFRHSIHSSFLTNIPQRLLKIRMQKDLILTK